MRYQRISNRIAVGVRLCVRNICGSTFIERAAQRLCIIIYGRRLPPAAHVRPRRDRQRRPSHWVMSRVPGVWRRQPCCPDQPWQQSRMGVSLSAPGSGSVMLCPHGPCSLLAAAGHRHYAVVTIAFPPATGKLARSLHGFLPSLSRQSVRDLGRKAALFDFMLAFG
jgi:hypothetical protein